MAWRGSTDTVDRVFACLPYILPIADSLIFAIAFVSLLPIVAPIVMPLVSIGSAYNNAVGKILGPQFGDLIIFFALYLLVVRNQRIKHFIRFHTMQAMMRVVIYLVGEFFKLINLPVFDLILSPTPLGMVLSLIFAGMFVVFAGCYLYSIFCAIQGKYAEIPWISAAAYSQTQF
jgi:hypothetical protein